MPSLVHLVQFTMCVLCAVGSVKFAVYSVQFEISRVKWSVCNGLRVMNILLCVMKSV